MYNTTDTTIPANSIVWDIEQYQEDDDKGSGHVIQADDDGKKKMIENKVSSFLSFQKGYSLPFKVWRVYLALSIGVASPFHYYKFTLVKLLLLLPTLAHSTCLLLSVEQLGALMCILSWAPSGSLLPRSVVQ